MGERKIASKSENYEDNNYKRKIFLTFYSKIIAIIIILLIIISAIPLYNGQVESNYWNPKSYGIIIPNSYFEVRDILSSESGNVLILPAMNVYILTSWNYFGTGYFYNSFFYPKKILDIQTMGKGIYSWANNSLVQQYLDLASPAGPSLKSSYTIIGNSSHQLVHLPMEYGGYGVWGANATSNFYGICINSTYSSYVHIIFNLKNSINLSEYHYIKLSLNTSSPSFWNSAIKSGNLAVGLGSPSGIIAWWNAKTLLYRNNNSYFSFYLPLDQGFWGSYNRSSVNQLLFNLDYNAKIEFPSMNISYPQIFGVPVSIRSSWLNLMEINNVKFIILDKSILQGLISSYTYADMAIELLVQSGYIKLIYNSDYLSLYEIIRYSEG